MKIKFFQNVSPIMLNNFYNDRRCLKIKLRWRNRKLCQKITEKRQNAGCMTLYDKKQEMICKKIFENVYLIILNNFYHDHSLKIKFRWRNRIWSQNLLKNGKMTDVWYHTSKSGRHMKRKFFQNVFLIMLNNSYHDQV